MKYLSILFILTLGCCFLQCKNREEKAKLSGQDSLAIRQEPVPVVKPTRPINYRLLPVKENEAWLRSLKAGDTLHALLLLNRTDARLLFRQDTLVFPDTIASNLDIYAPFPDSVRALKPIQKLIVVSYPAQLFAVYANGARIRWGAVSLGKKTTPTPTGLYATNWKSKKTTSTIDKRWVMEWYFNLANFEGVSMHQYALPGYPASHACVRLSKDDAYWFYYWADGWMLDEASKIAAYGTPVVIYGKYPFGQRKPWLELAANHKALLLTEEALMAELNDFLPTIMARQMQRDSVLEALSVGDQQLAPDSIQ